MSGKSRRRFGRGNPGSISLHVCAVSCALAWIFAGAGQGRAQAPSRSDSTEFRFVGQVRDLRSGKPVARAVLEIPERHALRVSNDSGFFTFDSMRAGTYHLTAQALGYASTLDSMTIRPGKGALVWLKPQPIVLPDVSVLVRRADYLKKLNRRVKATGYDYTIIGPQELARSPSANLLTVLQAKAAIEFTLCPGQSSAHSMVGPVQSFTPEVDEQDLGTTPACVRHRGRLVRVHVVYNDLGVPGSLMLSNSPRDFYLVQLIPALHLLRLYTFSYIEAMARRGWNPEPICELCGRMGRATGG